MIPLAASPAPAAVRGSVLPRIFTPPLVDVSEWEHSYGHDVVAFAESIGWPLDPWEQWAAIHLGELTADGTPRFRFVLMLVARQNGKTTLLRVLTLYWMFIEKHELVIGTSTSRDTAKSSWQEVIKMAESVDYLVEKMPELHTRETIGEEKFFTDGCDTSCRVEHEHDPVSTYRFAAPNRRAGRSYTVKRAVLDELREHHVWDVYDALINAGNAVADFQAVAITNQGDMNAIVLDSVRDSAIGFIETGQGDPRLFMAEWSAPNGADPTDVAALAAANPNLGLRIPVDALMGQAIQAKQAGGERLARFRTEVLCQRVTLLDPAIDPDLWDAGHGEVADLGQHRRAVGVCLDVALDGAHATLVSAAVVDGLVHVDVVRSWSGHSAVQGVRAELPDLIERIRPRMFGWFPAGPAAAIAADLKARRGRGVWPPRGVRVEELSPTMLASICMGLDQQVTAGALVHDDPLLDEQVKRTQRLRRGDTWTFTRSGSESVDGTYATAGAVHLARTMPVIGPAEAG
jgi:phage terminase large subunit-like protein